jgi:hypothetical protein
MSAKQAPVLHTCIVCWKRAPWDDNWSWYGSVLEAEADPETIEKVCSEACKRKHKPRPRGRKKRAPEYGPTDDTHLPTP